MPQKNQMEISRFSVVSDIANSLEDQVIRRLEEDEVEDEEDGDDDDGPEERLLEEVLGTVVGQWRGAVDEAGELWDGVGLGHEADDDGDEDADDPGPEGAVEV